MGALNGLKPQKVFEFFEYISSVPRGSGNTSKAADLCVDFAKQRGLICYRDSFNNVVIYKKASKGCESAGTVVLQGHLDMVCAKDAACKKDMSKESIDLDRDEEYVFASGTTLGGDDGIAIAYILAVLDSDSLITPAIEAVFTTEEETGMDGAKGINPEIITGRRLINIDSEVEGVFTCGCAGGVRINAEIPVRRITEEENKFREGYSLVRILLSGLKGGHSGIEIVSQPASANYLIGRVLYEMYERIRFYLLDLEGGEFDNVISPKASADIIVENERVEELIAYIERYNDILRSEYSSVNPDINLSCENISLNNLKYDMQQSPVETESMMNGLLALYLCPQGVIEMDSEIDGMVRTSVNLGVIKLERNKLVITFLVRSSVESQKDTLTERIISLIKLLGGSADTLGRYPGWKYIKESGLRKLCVRTYKELFKKDPIVNTIHAGLECGIFADKLEGLDAISLGPDILNIHTPNEKLSIASVGRMWEFLKKTLEELAMEK